MSLLNIFPRAFESLLASVVEIFASTKTYMIQHSPKIGTMFSDWAANMEAYVSFREIVLKSILLGALSILRQG